LLRKKETPCEEGFPVSVCFGLALSSPVPDAQQAEAEEREGGGAGISFVRYSQAPGLSLF
jgi:hypothetical protein